MSATAVRAGRAFVEVFADTSPLARGLKKAGKMLAGWADGLKSIGKQWAIAGSAGVGAFLGAAKVFADAGGALDDMSQRTGVSVEALSALKYAAEQSGTSLEAVEAGVKKLSVNLAEAAGGSQSARDKFTKLGLSFNDLAKMSPEKQFVAIAERLSQIEDPGQKAAATIDILGKSGADLIPLMNGGANGVAALVEEAERLGLVMTSAEATAAAEFGDKLDRAWAIAGRTVGRVGSAVLSALGPFLDMLIPLAAATGQWIENNRGLFQIILAVSAALAAAGFGMMFLGTVIQAVFTVGSAALVVLAGVGLTLGFLGGLIGGPVGIAFAALIAFLAGTVDWSNTLKTSIEWVTDAFNTLAGESVDAVNGIVAAISAGRIEAAWDIVLAYLELQWLKLTGVLREGWHAVVDPIVDVWHTAVFKIAEVGLKVFYGVADTWSAMMATMRTALIDFVGFFTDKWATSLAYIESGWVRLKGLFDSEINVEAEVSRIDKQLTDQLGSNRQGREGAKADIISRRNADISRIQADRSGALSSLSEQNTAERDARAKRRLAAEDAAQKKLDEAKAAFTATVQEVAKATEEAEASRASSIAAASGGIASSITGSFNPMSFRGAASPREFQQQKLIEKTDVLITAIDEMKAEFAAYRKEERERPGLK